MYDATVSCSGAFLEHLNSRTDQSRAEQIRAEQSRAEHIKAEQSRAEHSGAQQGGRVQSRPEQRRAGQSSSFLFFVYYGRHLFLWIATCAKRSNRRINHKERGNCCFKDSNLHN